jgi:hypothetical protein
VIVRLPRKEGDRRIRQIIMESESKVRHSKRAKNLADDGHDDKRQCILYNWDRLRVQLKDAFSLIIEKENVTIRATATVTHHFRLLNMAFPFFTMHERTWTILE